MVLGRLRQSLVLLLVLDIECQRRVDVMIMIVNFDDDVNVHLCQL